MFIKIILSKTLDTVIYDFIQGINFFTYERQFMKKLLRLMRITIKELSDRSIIDITTAFEIIFW